MEGTKNILYPVFPVWPVSRGKQRDDEGTFLFIAESQVINAEGMIELGHPYFATFHEIMELGRDNQLNP